VHADLDTLVIALYVTIDEPLGRRRGPGLPALGHLFPYLPTPSDYNRRLRQAGPWSPWPSGTSPRTPPAGATSCAWSPPPRCGRGHAGPGAGTAAAGPAHLTALSRTTAAGVRAIQKAAQARGDTAIFVPWLWPSRRAVYPRSGPGLAVPSAVPSEGVSGLVERISRACSAARVRLSPTKSRKRAAFSRRTAAGVPGPRMATP
jgi:hypothetical protein